MGNSWVLNYEQEEKQEQAVQSGRAELSLGLSWSLTMWALIIPNIVEAPTGYQTLCPLISFSQQAQEAGASCSVLRKVLELGVRWNLSKVVLIRQWRSWV